MLMFLVFLASCLCHCYGKTVYYQPEQIHLSYGDDPTSMLVAWSTMSSVPSSIVEYGVAEYGVAYFNMSANGSQKEFIDGGSEHHTQYIHTVSVTGLIPGQKYVYHCGSSLGWSSRYSFTAMRQGNNWSPRIVMFGDMGNVNAQSLPRLQTEVEEGMYDAVFHIGKHLYDNANVGDEFMRQIEPIAANVPYMTCPGNHETRYNFSNYKNRFAMPGDLNGENMFYSFDIGPAHVISFSSEFYFALEYGYMQPVRQYEWLERDLKIATSAAKKAVTPWIITLAHRPMYCSNTDHDDCTKKDSIVRTGVLHLLGLENLFYKYGVDLMLWAHEHTYERLWPVFNKQVYNGTSSPYVNPGAPVHIITGSAGCQEDHDGFKTDPAKWSAFRSTDYGYTRMNILNSTHIYMEQVSDDKNGTIIDRIMMRFTASEVIQRILGDSYESSDEDVGSSDDDILPNDDEIVSEQEENEPEMQSDTDDGGSDDSFGRAAGYGITLNIPHDIHTEVVGDMQREPVENIERQIAQQERG
ncbi:hypothetical protein ScPMuIL_001645 [Solemya velum]